MNDIFGAYPRPWRIDDNNVFHCATGEAFYVSAENRRLEAAIVECVNDSAQLAAAQERVKALERIKVLEAALRKARPFVEDAEWADEFHICPSCASIIDHETLHQVGHYPNCAWVDAIMAINTALAGVEPANTSRD